MALRILVGRPYIVTLRESIKSEHSTTSPSLLTARLFATFDMDRLSQNVGLDMIWRLQPRQHIITVTPAQHCQQLRCYQNKTISAV